MKSHLGPDSSNSSLCGGLMDGEGDQYEERLREVFQSFDGNGAGSLNPEELAELCHALQLNDTAIHTLLHTLLDTQDQLTARVEFEQFKNALILVLSSTEETLTNEESPARPDSPEVQPRFVKGNKRYGRRSTPEFTHAISEPPEEELEEEATEISDGTISIKRERWNADLSSPEEYEAEGQLHLWNPDEPSTPRGSMAPLSDLEERLHSACQQLSLPLNGMATPQQLHTLCQHLGMEVGEDAFQSVDEECMMSVQEFVSCVLNRNKPPTPSASTPYRQLKRHHSMQPFDETGRRISSLLSGTIGLRLFSGLDDGTGHTAVDQLLDTWLEEGVENCTEILQALDFSLDGKVNLSELTAALENELLITKNSIHQAALVSFKAEIRHLLERVDLELREKEKIRSDLEKAEKLKSQLASDVDEHHSAIERINDLNLRKLEQEYKDRMATLRVELSKEVELVRLQANQQSEELEQEIRRIRDDESFLREHLTLTIKENGRLESELLDSTERLIEADAQLTKLQKNLDSVLKEKFGDLDLSNAEFYQQEERLRQLRSSYEEQCRELQDRIDELQAQLEDCRAMGRTPQLSLMPSLSDELDSRSPGRESDQGLGSEDGQAININLETEMMLEQLKEEHNRELKNIRAQLDTTMNECQHELEEQKTALENERSLLSTQHQQEIQALQEEAAEALEKARGLQEQLDQERLSMELRQSEELADLRTLHQQELDSLNQEAQDTKSRALQLEEQLRDLEECGVSEREELNRAHAEELRLLELQHKDALEARIQEERDRLLLEKENAEKRLAEEWDKEKQQLEEIHNEVLKVRLEEVQQMAEQERVELERRLWEDWEKEKLQIEESNKTALQAVLEEELVRLLKDQEDRERELAERWEEEHTLLQQQVQQEVERVRADEEKAQGRRLEEQQREMALLQLQHEEMLQARLEEQREQLQTEREKQERRWQEVLEEEQSRMEEAHREAMQELSAKHCEERERLSCMLEKLRTDIGEERKELETHFSQRIKEVEARFSGDQEAVSERFQTDVRKLEQHYQSELSVLTQRHAAERAQWEEELEAAVQEAEQQRKLLREALQLERENMVQEFAKERETLENSHAAEMEALREKNLELQNQLENFISSAQMKEIELSRQLNELHNRLQENLETKDALLSHAECRAEELEQLLRQATEDFAQERAELQCNLLELEAQQTETHSLAEKQIQERSDLLAEREELKGKLEELEKVLRQAVEDFHYERLELQGTVAELEEKLKESVSLILEKEEQRVALLTERDSLELKVQEMEAELAEATRAMAVDRQVFQELGIGMEFLASSAENFIAVRDACEDETADHQSEDFSVLGADSPSVQDEDLEGELTLQKENAGDFAGEDAQTVNAEMLKISGARVLSCDESDCRDSSEKVEKEEDGFYEPGGTYTLGRAESTDKLSVGNLDNDYHECVVSWDSIRSVDVSEEMVDLTIPNLAAEDGEGFEAGEPVEEFPSVEMEVARLCTLSEDDKVEIPSNLIDEVEEEKGVDKDSNAVICNRTVVPGAECGVTNRNVGDNSANDDNAENIPEVNSISIGEILPEEGLIETVEMACTSEKEEVDKMAEENPLDSDIAIAAASLDEDNVSPSSFVISSELSEDVLSERQNKDYLEPMLENAEVLRIVEECSEITGTLDLEKDSDDSTQLNTAEEDQGKENEAQESAEVISDSMAMDNEPNNVEVADQYDSTTAEDEASCHKEPIQDPKAIDQADIPNDLECPELTVALENESMVKETNQQETHEDQSICAREILELQEIAVQFKDQSSLLEVLQDQYSSAVEQNLSLQEQLSLLQQHTNELELLLDLNRGKLQESHELRVELIALAAQAKELEIKELELTDLQKSYEECVCENLQLVDRNRKLEKRVQNLESRMNIVQEFQEQQTCLLEEIARVREENAKLSMAVQELEKQDEMMLALQQDAESSDSSDDSSLDLGSQLEAKIAAVSELEDCCTEFEKQNSRLRHALANLQEKSLRIHDRMQEHRSEAGRLAEENLVLRQKISALKEEDLRENQHELLLQVEHFRKERSSAQKVVDGLKRQISELRRRGQQLEEENDALSQQNVKHALSVDTLQHTLEEMIRHSHGNGSSNEGRELENVEDFVAPVIRTEKLEEEKELLKAELNRCVEKMTRYRSLETQFAQLLNERQTSDKHNQALRTQLIKAQEKVQAVDSTVQGLTQQNARLKSDLRITLQERDALKQEVISLHKQLQNSNEKCRLVEMSISGISGGSQQGKRVWTELSGLMEAELTLLREENQRLQCEISDSRLELNSAREKARQLEMLVLSIKQQKQQTQASLAKAAEQERSAFKREMEALHTQLHNKICDSSEEQRVMESLQEENERLKNKQTILEAQLMEAQLIAMLPPSPLRLPGERRGQRLGDDMIPDVSVQEERELALLKMEERMKEVELTLRNVKLLLQEKVSQLKEQLNKNSKADVLIKDLYVENAQLLKALEMSEQRHKVTEKKNYLLEEKISSLNKIVRELSPSPLTPVPYHFTRS
ncbi:ninein isoform X1 [Astyanax mexicanus]|uniref:ninein isoform X1 n=2 Tax=Astyanax mexicanus TaxID=7994 RepID=UPI0020CADE8E|nr:ninein isoform X1 [Astyanax mexicanus]